MQRIIKLQFNYFEMFWGNDSNEERQIQAYKELKLS